MENTNKDKKNNYKNNKVNYKMIVGTAVIVLSTGAFVWESNQNNAYAIAIDNQVVAVTKDKETVELAYTNLVENIKGEVNADIAVNEELQVKPVRAKENEMLTKEQVTKAIGENISYGVEAYEILVDGESQAIIGEPSEAKLVLEEIANQYLPNEGELTLDVEDVDDGNKSTEVPQNPEKAKEVLGDVKVNKEDQVITSSKSNTEVDEDGLETIEVEEARPQEEVVTHIQVGEIEVEPVVEVAEEENSQKIQRQMNDLKFNEEVVVKSVYVPKEEIISVDNAKKVLMKSSTVEVEYTLQEGDNIWDIAMSHGTTMDRIMEINPQVKDETLMQIGDIIKVEVPKPVLSISTKEEAIFKEVIPGEIEYVVFSDLYEDETKVYQEGHDGVKELTVEVTKVNGEEVARKTVSEKVLKEAKTKVIAYGVKERPVVTKPENNQGSNTGNTSSGSSNSNSASGSNSNIGNSNFIHPLKGAGRVSSEYGPRWGTFHHGIDFAAPSGTPVYASASGEVIYSGYNNGGYGYLVIIDHGNGYQTYYAHNSSLYVSVGSYVSQGQHIAGVGTTGDSTGNHLHFEVRKNGTPINPRNVL